MGLATTQPRRHARRAYPAPPGDETFRGPGIDDAPRIDLFTLAFVAVIHAVTLEDFVSPGECIVRDALCAVRCSG